MRLYYEVARRAFRRATTYRVSFLSGLLTNAFFGAMISSIYLAAYGGRDQMAGYPAQEAISYLWAAQALISVGSAWVTSDLSRAIRSGDVAVDLMRPWNFYAYWLSQQLGDRLFNLLLRGSLTYVIGVLYYGARLPALSDLPVIALSIALAVLISSAYSFLLNATAFWLLDDSGILTIGSIITMFFSGFLIPLAFFPPWLASIASFLPFQAIAGLPIEIFLGRLHGVNLAQALAVQCCWAIILTGLALIQMRAAMQKIVIQGG
jgi:ABC-2 type transport system permease protein